MTITIVGVGLISGSFALAMKKHGFAQKVIGISRTPESVQKALALGIIDEALPLEEAIPQSDLIYIAIPVDAAITTMKKIMELITDKQIITDAGSTKYKICRAIEHHPRRKQFVAAHPMWGTENSGPEAAEHNAFAGRACVICEPEKSHPQAVELIEKCYTTFGMHIVNMDAYEHDRHVAYVSHISHITSFALANTVLEKEKEEEAIFELASGGFESTVRLAKSSPAMWAPIFIENRDNILEVLEEHIRQLRKFVKALETQNTDALQNIMSQANTIKKVLNPATPKTKK